MTAPELGACFPDGVDLLEGIRVLVFPNVSGSQKLLENRSK